MLTPRPEISVTVAAVDTPGRQHRPNASRSESSCDDSAVMRPLSTAEALHPLDVHASPSSRTSSTTRSLTLHVALHRRPSWLAAHALFLGWFNPVVDGVAQQVQHRVVQLVDDGAVELGAGAGDDQLDVSAAAPGDVAGGAWQSVMALSSGGPQHFGQALAHLPHAGGRQQQLACGIQNLVHQLGAHAHGWAGFWSTGRGSSSPLFSTAGWVGLAWATTSSSH